MYNIYEKTKLKKEMPKELYFIERKENKDKILKEGIQANTVLTTKQYDYMFTDYFNDVCFCIDTSYLDGLELNDGNWILIESIDPKRITKYIEHSNNNIYKKVMNV